VRGSLRGSRARREKSFTGPLAEVVGSGDLDLVRRALGPDPHPSREK
jgi:hypothetical protein